MSHTDAIAQVYARSIYELAEQAGGRDKILEIAQELEQICELTRGDRQLSEFFGSPVIDSTRRRETIGRIFNEQVTDLTLRFLLVLNDKGRLSHLESITEAFDQFVHASFGRVEVDVYTAAPLEENQRETMRRRIGAALGKDAVLYAYTDLTMIGGLKMRIGDQLVDGSVATRLRRMRTALQIPSASANKALREAYEGSTEEDAK